MPPLPLRREHVEQVHGNIRSPAHKIAEALRLVRRVLVLSGVFLALIMPFVFHVLILVFVIHTLCQITTSSSLPRLRVVTGFSLKRSAHRSQLSVCRAVESSRRVPLRPRSQSTAHPLSGTPVVPP
eukprot:2272528-Rhodomonas_salina.4